MFRDPKNRDSSPRKDSDQDLESEEEEDEHNFHPGEEPSEDFDRDENATPLKQTPGGPTNNPYDGSPRVNNLMSRGPGTQG